MAEEGLDVPVFCHNTITNKTEVRMMRNPRLTGINQKILKITFDDGSSVRCTENHKFLMKNGKYIEAKNLNINDRLHHMVRFQSTLDEVFHRYVNKSRKNQYMWINNGIRNTMAEHRIVAQYKINRQLNRNEVVHHIDNNSMNNSIHNLHVMDRNEHIEHHRIRMIENNPMKNPETVKKVKKTFFERYGREFGSFPGETNPMFKGIFIEQLETEAEKIMLEKGRRISTSEWTNICKLNNWPYSGYFTYKKYKSVSNFLSEISKKVGLYLSMRTLGWYLNLEKYGQHLEIDFENHDFYITKKCNICNTEYKISWNKRNFKHCPSVQKFDRVKTLRETLTNKSFDTKIKQIEIFKELTNKLGREPQKEEWHIECKLNSIPSRFRSGKEKLKYYNENIFTSWKEFKNAANNYFNYKVVSIEDDGYENVYNGTVDDHHNYYIFTSEGLTKSGNRKLNYVCSKNCGESVLRSRQLCNLTEAVIRPGDSLDELKTKVRYATILGVIQSTLTNFNFVSRDWKKNCEEERLLGVSLTGLADHEILSKKSTKAKEYLFAMKQEADRTMKEWCNILEINESKQVGLVKPSGTVSLMVNSSAGLHPRYSQFYIRRVRIDRMDPLARLLMDKNVPVFPETGSTMENCSTYVFEFPIKAPSNARLRDEMTAIQQLEYWKMIKEVWCDGNPSCTIYVKESEWLEILAWIWKNWDFIGGISFLPYDTGVYKLAPYEEISEEKYEELSKSFPEIDFSLLSQYEKEDETQGATEYACVGGACEI